MVEPPLNFTSFGQTGQPWLHAAGHEFTRPRMERDAIVAASNLAGGELQPLYAGPSRA